MCEDNSLMVIGAGMPRTGTMSLKLALELIYNRPCYHMIEVLDNHPDHIELWSQMFQASQIVDKPVLNEEWIREIFKNYGCVTDAPACAFYQTLMSLYPEAKVILTVRNSKVWVESIRGTVRPKNRMLSDSWTDRFVERLLMIPGFVRMTERFWHQCFGKDIDLDNDEQLEEAFNQWNKAVQSKVPQNKLLVFDIKMGWEPLCKFLNVPIPDQPFPHVNDREQFKKRVSRIYTLKRFIQMGWFVFGVGLAVICFRSFSNVHYYES